MSNEVYRSRFSDAPWLLDDNLKPIITVGGAGGIGSWLLLFLSRTGNYSRILLYENDTLDETNIAGQFFKPTQIPIHKVNAIRQNMHEFSSYSNVDGIGTFSNSSVVTPITFSAFDNMKARSEMFNAWRKMGNREIFIDGRMIFEDGQIYAVTKGREEMYEKTLFDDEEVRDGPCSMKATTHTGAYIASMMLAIFNNYLTNNYKYKDDINYVPFRYIFSFPSLLIEVS